MIECPDCESRMKVELATVKPLDIETPHTGPSVFRIMAATGFVPIYLLAAFAIVDQKGLHYGISAVALSLVISLIPWQLANALKGTMLESRVMFLIKTGAALVCSSILFLVAYVCSVSLASESTIRHESYSNFLQTWGPPFQIICILSALIIGFFSIWDLLVVLEELLVRPKNKDE